MSNFEQPFITSLSLSHELERPITEKDRYFVIKYECTFGNMKMDGEIGWIETYFDLKEFQDKHPKITITSWKEYTKKDYYKWRNN